MNYYTVCLVFAALWALYLFESNHQFGGRRCILCGATGKHHKSCPQRDRDEDE